MVTVIVANIWRGTAFSTVYSAALADVPPVTEAAGWTGERAKRLFFVLRPDDPPHHRHQRHVHDAADPLGLHSSTS